MIIEQLELYTSNLQEQAEFYSNVLQLKLNAKDDNSVSFQVGHSILKFIYKEDCTPYHYAFNIPSNKADEALLWLKERVEILKDGESEIQYFDFWDAYAIYFYDQDQNIVEFIARKRLNKSDDKKFTSQSIYGISEIGIATDDIEKQYSILHKNTGISIHSGSTDRFCAIGDDEEGMFIIINSNLKKEWYPTQDRALRSDFSISINHNRNPYQFAYISGNLKHVNL